MRSMLTVGLACRLAASNTHRPRLYLTDWKLRHSLSDICASLLAITSDSSAPMRANPQYKMHVSARNLCDRYRTYRRAQNTCSSSCREADLSMKHAQERPSCRQPWGSTWTWGTEIYTCRHLHVWFLAEVERRVEGPHINVGAVPNCHTIAGIVYICMYT